MAQVIHQDASEAEVVKKPVQIPLTGGEENPLSNSSFSASGQSDQDATALSKGTNAGHQERRAKQKRKKRKKRKR